MPEKSIRCITLLCLVIAGLSCNKTIVEASGEGSAGVGASLAAFKVIPLPASSAGELIIPNLSQFYVTNMGPYVQIQNGLQQKWSVYKYKGGTGSDAWAAFTPSFTANYFRPTSMFYEKDNSFSIYWCNTNLANDKYGIYNINTGMASAEYLVPEGASGPAAFTEVIPPTASANPGGVWGISGNQIWRESMGASPKKFILVLDLPDTSTHTPFDAVMADPDLDSDIWIAAGPRFYQVSETGNATPPYGKSKMSWYFTHDSVRIQAFLKIDGKVVIQSGKNVFMQAATNSSTFNPIGNLKVPTGVVRNICTNGSSIFASDGTYYNDSIAKWKPFIGSGQNLSGNDANQFATLKSYMQTGAPIGCIYGPASNKVYLLTKNALIQITPVF